jgi:hypothetical protein
MNEVLIKLVKIFEFSSRFSCRRCTCLGGLCTKSLCCIRKSRGKINNSCVHVAFIFIVTSCASCANVQQNDDSLLYELRHVAFDLLSSKLVCPVEKAVE